MINYHNYLNELENIAVAKVETQKRIVMLYEKKILVFKKYGYNVVLENFIRISDIQSFSYVKSDYKSISLEVKLAKGVKTISFKNPSSTFAVNNFIGLLNSIVEKMNPQYKPFYQEDWYAKEMEELYDDDYDDESVEATEEELITFNEEEQSWTEYVQNFLSPDSHLLTDNEFVSCEGNRQKVLDIGLNYYNHCCYEEAFQCFKIAAALGNICAFLPLGKCYLYGQGTAVNPQAAMHWLCQAACNYKSAIPLVKECCQLMYKEG